MKFLTPRALFLFGFLACFALLLFAIYLETNLGLAPCPLCQLQRYVTALIGFLFLLAFLLKLRQKGIKIFSVLIFISALLGLALAGRQIWLQHLPAGTVINCGVSLNYLLRTFPLADVLRVALQGSGECTQVTWRWLGLSIPEWTFLSFSFFALLSVFQFVRKK